jgi:chromosome segregation ATPase
MVKDTHVKFSYFFERLGCVGEIYLNESEKFENWGIEILVKFRDDEKLERLTHQRQSGGVSYEIEV